MSAVSRIYVGIGSNVDVHRHIAGGLEALHGRFGDVSVSAPFRSAALGVPGPDFINLVIAFDSALGWQALRMHLRSIETEHGRIRGEHEPAAVTLDLDLLMMGDTRVASEQLQLPAPAIASRAFVLAPLADLAPAVRHPLLGLMFAELWSAFDPALQATVKRMHWPEPRTVRRRPHGEDGARSRL